MAIYHQLPFDIQEIIQNKFIEYNRSSLFCELDHATRDGILYCERCETAMKWIGFDDYDLNFNITPNYEIEQNGNTFFLCKDCI